MGAFEFSSALGVTKSQILEYTIYPNPTTDIVHINFNTPSNIGTIKVFNYLGEKIMSQQILNKDSSIDFSGLNNGFYFIDINTIENHSVSKIILHQ